MGVPITFLDKYNPEQFEISGIDRYIENNPNYGKRFSINKKRNLCPHNNKKTNSQAKAKNENRAKTDQNSRGGKWI